MSLSFSHAHSQGSGTTEVVAVLIAITNNTARVLTVDGGKLLPNGPLMPLHRSLQAGVRQWVEEQTQQPLGYIEQLYTFVDTNRRNADGHALVYVSYMGLVQESELAGDEEQPRKAVNTKNKGRQSDEAVNDEALGDEPTNKADTGARWRDWYDYFPWENHLHSQSNSQSKRSLTNQDKLKQQNKLDTSGNPNRSYQTDVIIVKLIQWANTAASHSEKVKRLQRICLCWGGKWEKDKLPYERLLFNSLNPEIIDGDDTRGTASTDQAKLTAGIDQLLNQLPTIIAEIFTEWVAEHALLRYEMLYEAGLLPESPDYQPAKLPKDWHTIIGEPMYYDHRRVIATAISRLRAKIEYRPLIFGLMPPEFTLLQLQKSVEALSGVPLHKQNFRRLLESQNLLEPTGNSRQTGRGRPAQLYRFRYDIELQSLLVDSKLPKRSQ